MRQKPVFEKDVKVIIIKTYYSETEAHIHQARLKEIGIKKATEEVKPQVGVAHEINNPLAIINQKAGLLKDIINADQNQIKVEEEFHDADLGDIQYEKSLNEYEMRLARTKQPRFIIWLLLLLILAALIFGFIMNS